LGFIGLPKSTEFDGIPVLVFNRNLPNRLDPFLAFVYFLSKLLLAVRLVLNLLGMRKASLFETFFLDLERMLQAQEFRSQAGNFVFLCLQHLRLCSQIWSVLYTTWPRNATHCLFERLFSFFGLHEQTEGKVHVLFNVCCEPLIGIAVGMRSNRLRQQWSRAHDADLGSTFVA
jgi:hypothetical protein